MTKSFAIVLTAISLVVLSLVWAQLININNEEEASEKTATVNEN